MTASSKSEYRAARAAVAAYHQAVLEKLIERLRAQIARYDAGAIDAFERDDLIHHYKRATQKLWSFCTGSGGQIETAARTLEWLREQDDLPDWWQQSGAAAPVPLRRRKHGAADAAPV